MSALLVHVNEKHLAARFQDAEPFLYYACSHHFGQFVKEIHTCDGVIMVLNRRHRLGSGLDVCHACILVEKFL